jgi:hypothetical protein
LLIAAASMVGVAQRSLASDDLGSLQDLLPPSQSNPTARSHDGRVRIFNNFLVHPMPVWSSFDSGPAPAEQSRIQTGSRNGTYRLTMIPDDEEFKQWKNLFAVTGHDGPVRALADHGRVVIQQFRTICSPSNTQTFLVESSNTRVMQVVACGNYSRDRAVGQIAVVVSMQNATGLVTMSRQWRTKSFQSRVQSSWPVSKLELDSVLVELSRARLIPVKKNNG